MKGVAEEVLWYFDRVMNMAPLCPNILYAELSQHQSLPTFFSADLDHQYYHRESNTTPHCLCRQSKFMNNESI